MPDAAGWRIQLWRQRGAYLLDGPGDQPARPLYSRRDRAGEIRRVAAAIRGEADALREVWQANRRWVAAVLLAHKPREAELDDLLQEVAMSYVRMIGQLRDEAMLKPWLRTVAVNTARAAGRDATRRRRGTPWLRGSETSETGKGEAAIRGGEAGGSPSPDEVVSQRQEAGRLVQLLEQLPEGYREPLMLKAVKGLSYREIGRVMDLPETTVETRITRGRRMLRELADASRTISKGGVA